MKHALIRQKFLDQFDGLFTPLVLLKAQTRDGQLIIEIDANKSLLHFRCMEVNRGTPTLLKPVIQQVSRASTNAAEFPALIAPRFSTGALELCSQSGISCFDLTGRVLINCKQAHINHPSNPSERIVDASIFSGKSAQVIRVLLANPTRIWKIRELGKEAQASIGLVSLVTQGLVQRGWVNVERGRGGIHLISPEGLVDAWREQYIPDVTTTSNLFSVDDSEEVETRLAKMCEQLNLPYAFTGTSAATLLSDTHAQHQVSLYVYPATVPLKILAESAALTRFTKTPGNIFIHSTHNTAFLYGASKVSQVWVVHPIQAYLDLWINPEERPLATIFRKATLNF